MTCPKTLHDFCAMYISVLCPFHTWLTYLYKCAKDTNGSYSFYNNRSIILFWKDCTSSIVYTGSFSVASYYWHPKHPKLDYEHYYKRNSLSMVSLKVYHNRWSLTSVHAQPIIKQPFTCMNIIIVHALR